MSLRQSIWAYRSAAHARGSVAPVPTPTAAAAATRRAFSSATVHAPSSAAAAFTVAAAPPPRAAGPSAVRRWTVRLAIALALPAAFIAGAVYPPQTILLLSPRYSPPPPDKDSKRGKSQINEVERELQRLFIVAKMRAKSDEWYETRPYERYDPQKVHNSLTAGSLRGPGKLAVPPIAFAKKDESEAVVLIHLGRALCGHDGIIHGGLLATVFDESLARNALLNLPSHIGVTANLSINYRSPCMADQFVIVRTKLDEKRGRKVNVSATMETLDGERIAEAKALFIEPKWAQFLESSGVTEALGTPRPVPVSVNEEQHQV